MNLDFYFCIWIWCIFIWLSRCSLDVLF